MSDEKIYEKLDKIGLDINEIKITQAVHTQQLTEHMRRTHLLETKLDQHESHDTSEHADFRKKLNKQEGEASGIKKTMWIVGALISIAVALSKLL